MGNVVQLDFRRAETGQVRLSPDEIGFMRSLVRATADLLGRERDSLYQDVIGFAGVANLDDLARERLATVTLFLHALQRKALGLDANAGVERT